MTIQPTLRRKPRRMPRELLGEVRAVAADVPRFAAAPVYRRWHLRWGPLMTRSAVPCRATTSSTMRQYRATRAITIDCPPEQVWPWLVQVGCLRAGFYANDLLDNLGHPSARTILPEFQSLEVGQWVPDVTNTIGHDRVQGGRVRAEPLAAVATAASTWSWTLKDTGEARRDWSRGCDPRGLGPPVHLDILRRAQRVRGLPDDAPHAAGHQGARRVAARALASGIRRRGAVPSDATSTAPPASPRQQDQLHRDGRQHDLLLAAH